LTTNNKEKEGALDNDKTRSPAIWLDLELREDIDDYLTLVYALEQGVDVRCVSIHNPSVNELKLLELTLNMFGSNADKVISGEITKYPDAKDVHVSLLESIKNIVPTNVIPLTEYLDGYNKPTSSFFCGGSLYTLSKALAFVPDRHWEAYIQGGYAGPSIVGEENTLKKFRKREAVPTWNLNLDLSSTDYVMNAANLTATFISKNICHDSWVHKNDINDNDCVFNRVLSSYFKNNKWPDKCMHDLLAFLTILDSDLVDFVPVTLSHGNEERPKWRSLKDLSSNKRISVSFDKVKFKKTITNYNALM
jgi:hypothetical protein